MPSMAGPILFLDCGAVGQGRLVNELQDPDSSDAVRPLADLDLVPELNELLDVALHPWVEYPALF